MAYQRKLGRTAAQRKALLRNQVTNLIWYGRIETTLARAKEVRSVAEHLITLAIRECDNTVSVEKTFNNDKGQSVTVTVQNDAPSKLHARRQIMAYLYDVKEPKLDDESKKAYAERASPRAKHRAMISPCALHARVSPPPVRSCPLMSVCPLRTA